jgi:hypothetical protein
LSGRSQVGEVSGSLRLEVTALTEAQARSTDIRIGQPFNPFGFFNGIFIPESMVRSTRISPGAKLTYGRLTRYAGQDGKCYPAVATLATQIGVSDRQTQRYLAELEDERLVRRITRFRERAQTSNGFEFLWHEMFQEPVMERTRDWATTVASHRVTDASPHPVTDPSQKESQIEESHLEEKNRKADSRHASPEAGEGSRRSIVRCWKPNQDSRVISAEPARIGGEETKPKPIWTDSDVSNVGNWLAAFMDGEQPPPKVLSWIMQLAERYKLSADDIHQALNGAWNRNARPGRKNRPKYWKWFYEVLRNAFIPGYAARVPEATS